MLELRTPVIEKEPLLLHISYEYSETTGTTGTTGTAETTGTTATPVTRNRVSQNTIRVEDTVNSTETKKLVQEINDFIRNHAMATQGESSPTQAVDIDGWLPAGVWVPSPVSAPSKKNIRDLFLECKAYSAAILAVYLQKKNITAYTKCDQSVSGTFHFGSIQDLDPDETIFVQLLLYSQTTPIPERRFSFISLSGKPMNVRLNLV